jgi:hypothetical protein
MDALQIFLSVASPFASAWLAARLTLDRFVREKAWERKAAAYTEIFGALHAMQNWYRTHIEAVETYSEIPPEQSKELEASYRQAEASLNSRLAAETWLLPAECATRLAGMQAEMRARHRDWYEHLDAGWAAIDSAITDLRDMTQKDMLLTRSPLISQLNAPWSRLNSLRQRGSAPPKKPD